jgi:hypothetical protein
MQNYQVTGKFVSFGVGAELKLSKNQANIRSHSLKKKSSNIYEVTELVHFKQGEKISTSSDTLNKMLLEQLKAISSEDVVDEEIESNRQYPGIEHVSFGKYNVFDQNKNLLTSKPIKKDQAEKILAGILVKNQTNNYSDNDSDSKQDDQELNIDTPTN